MPYFFSIVDSENDVAIPNRINLEAFKLLTLLIELQEEVRQHVHHLREKREQESKHK